MKIGEIVITNDSDPPTWGGSLPNNNFVIPCQAVRRVMHLYCSHPAIKSLVVAVAAVAAGPRLHYLPVAETPPFSQRLASRLLSKLLQAVPTLAEATPVD
jgi:hypothetical protein